MHKNICMFCGHRDVFERERVIRDFGGAYKTLKYAEKTDINIINIK